MTRTAPSRRTLALAALTALTFTAVACGSDDSSSSDTTAAATEESYEVVPDSVVTAGLTATITGANALAAQIGDGADQAAFEDLFEVWEGFEGTVKQNEPDSYLAIEDALTALKGAIESDDADAGNAAVTDLQAAADAYLAKHP